MFLKYECYIAAGSHVDVGNDENDRKLTEEYARSKAQITLVTFLHKQVFQKLTHWFARGTNPVCCFFFLGFIDPILGNCYSFGVSSCQQTWDDHLGWPDPHPPP